MPEGTGILRKEHDAILKMLTATEAAAHRIQSGGTVPTETLEGLIEFFRLFADRCHHGKEEDLLFPLLQEKGMPRAGGPIGVMLAEHDQGRSLIKQMADASEAYQAGATGSGSPWAEAARGYCTLLRGHIDKENDVLFVMAERMLSPAEQGELAESFEKIEVEKMGVGTHERLHAMMDNMVKEFLGKS